MGEPETNARAREVGDLLRQIREAMNLTTAEAAERVGWSASKVSRVERGATGASPVELVRLAAHCGADLGDIDFLLDRCKEVTPPGYWLANRFASLLFHESTAAFSSSYDPLVVPGLLETEEYATALMGRQGMDPGIARYKVGARMERQRLLQSRGFEFFVHEQALRLPVGGNRVMNEQMLKLVLLADQPRITIRVVPTVLGERGVVGGSFVLFRYADGGPLVFVDHVGLFLENRDLVASFQNRLARLSDVAMGREESREVLATLASEFDQPEDSPNAPDLAEEQFQ